jgi:anoctamin-10
MLCITPGTYKFAALCPYGRQSVLILLLRVKDWLHGVCQTAPVKDAQGRLNPASLTEAERLRIICLLNTNPRSEGGAGVILNEGDWREVDAIFPLHDHNFNEE